MNRNVYVLGRQQGAVLIVGLSMLLLLTVIGLSSIRGSELQERMAGNMRDHNQAFQAAEAALRHGEGYLNGAAVTPFNAATKIGYYEDLNKPGGTIARPTMWTSSDWNARATSLASDTLIGVSSPPLYVIERVMVSTLASNPGGAIDLESLDKMSEMEYYRVTSKGLGGTQDAEVILQSTFIR